MKNFIAMVCFTLALLGLSVQANAQCGNAYLGGLMDGSTTASYPKFIMVCADADIADLSIYTIGTANNGGGTTGPNGEFTFPGQALAAGDCVTIADGGNGGEAAFIDYFGCAPDFVNGVASINGDDAVELFCSGTLEDVYGDVNVDGTGQAWEYTDGWAARMDNTTDGTYDMAKWVVASNQSPTMHNFNDNGFETVDCPPCSDYIVTACAFCNNATNGFVEGSYYVSVSTILGGLNTGTYDVTVGGTTQTFTGAGITFGPFTHSGSGTAVMTGTISEPGSNCTYSFEVYETMCTDLPDGTTGSPDNDLGFCSCGAAGGGGNPGTVFAQSEPGTFVAGGTSGNVQLYLLVDGNTGTVNIVNSNNTGLFTNLPSGTYYVYALNYATANAADVLAALASGAINVTDLSTGVAPYDDECYSLCGPGTYDLACGSGSTNLACNDHINVTVDANCDVNLGIDAFLEGNHGGDADYTVVVTTDSGIVVDLNGSTTPTTDDVRNFIGEDLTYTVTDICSGNTCWGTVTLEDKSIPDLNCDEVTVLCTELDNLSPGAAVKGWDRAVGAGTIAPGASGNISLTLDDVFGTVSNVILNFAATVDEASDLTLSLASPGGQSTIVLIDHMGFATPCENGNYNICLSDAGTLSHAMFNSPVHCRSTINAFIGSFQPLNAFNGFDGDDANGAWTLTITNGGTTAISVTEADLQVTTDEGNLLTATQVFDDTGCLIAPVFDFEDEEIGQHCQGDNWTTIERTWSVRNPNSGQTGSCQQLIHVRRFSASDIIAPKNYDGIDQDALTCADENLDTGEPHLPCSNELESCGNMLMSGPTTVEFPLCGNSYKRIYTWTVLDWCTGESVEITQVVKLHDNEPIVMSCVPDNITDADAMNYDMNTNSYLGEIDDHGDCTGKWKIVPPLSIDNPCDDNTTLAVYFLPDDDTNPNDAPTNVDYTLFTADYQDGDELTGLPADRRTWIRMVVTDECGNTGECFTEVDIEDTAAPFCIAVEYVTVGMYDTGNGLTGKVNAESIDNGSFDNCSGLTFEIKRASGQCNASDTQWGEFVKFCCADIVGDAPYEIPVELRVTDAAGNFCTVNSKVRLQTNATNTTTCPDGVVLDCEDDLDQFYGVPTIDGPCGAIDITFDLDAVIAATSPSRKSANESPQYDSDGNGSPDAIPAYDEQCGFGAVKRNFFDANGSLVCAQYFVIEPANPFNPNSIVWPSDATTNCNAFDFGEPSFTKSSCGKTGISLESDTLFIVDNACYKILNQWRVIDWCAFDQTGGASGIYESVQVITVIDNTTPQISAETGQNYEVDSGCSYSGVTLLASASDDDLCPEDELVWTIEVDHDDDGTVDETISETSYPGDTISVNLSAVPVNKSGHSITWTVSDDCGNSSSSETRITVEDVKKPTPYCLNVSTATMENGQLEIWASDFNAGSFDNCTANDDLTFSFSDNQNETSMVITDADLNDVGQIALTIYTWDECGNNDFCIVTVTFSGSFDQGAAIIEGQIMTEMGESVQSVMTELMANVPGYPNYNQTITTGEYAFSNNPMYFDYTLTGEKNDDYLNGVSTLDLVIIQKHILGNEALNSPYKMIAADVNNDNAISALDLIELRKLILGIYQELPNNGSWKFVEASQALTILNPWIYNESIVIENLDQPMLNEDFIGVKIGDVNNSMVSNVVSQATELRSGGGIELTYDDRFMPEGNHVEIQFAADETELFGYQFTLQTTDLEILEVTGRDIVDNNFAMHGDMLAISHNSDFPIHTSPGFITLKVEVKKAGWLSDMLQINSKITRSEAYVGNTLDIVNVKLRSDKENTFKVYQNEPNPFANQTLIGFELPEAGKVKVSLYDVAGKLIKILERDGTKGYNSVIVSKDDLGQTGLIYYKVESGNNKATKHMIMIK